MARRKTNKEFTEEVYDLVGGEYTFLEEYVTSKIKIIGYLRFDFAILDSDGSVICLIEYDGRQYYEPIDFFGGLESYLKTRRNDIIKNEYTLSNKIPLLRIPYWEFENIDTLVEGFFNGVYSSRGVCAK